MLRIVLIALSWLLLAGAGILVLTGHPEPGLITAFAWGVLLFIGVVFERRFYKRILDKPPGEGWTATGERFVDPESGAATEVYFNQASGKRVYVRLGAGGQA